MCEIVFLNSWNRTVIDGKLYFARPQPSVLKCHVNINCQTFHLGTSETGLTPGCLGNPPSLPTGVILVFSQHSWKEKVPPTALTLGKSLCLLETTGYQRAALKEKCVTNHDISHCPVTSHSFIHTTICISTHY